MARRKDRQPEPRWLPLYEAADYLNVPHRTLRDWISRGLVPAYKVGPRQIQLRTDDLDRLRKRIPTARAV